MSNIAKADNQEIDRQKYIQKILNSTSSKKIIVAGPGTGKTSMFEYILKKSGSQNNLVLTFINRLVNDLSLRLGNYAKVSTLHKFCLDVFYNLFPNWHMVSDLVNIISEDTGVKKDLFEELFHKVEENDPRFKLYLERALYYKAISFNDLIYRVFKKAIVEPNVFSHYDNILIDEYQDFSALEVEFIKQLESHGNILIVGDDDQAIYKNKFDLGKSLRILYHSNFYEHFELPYCSRCPKVIVDSINDIVKEAVKKGYLKERINKKFIAYEEGKEGINNNYPKLKILNMASVDAASCFLDYFIKTIINKEIDNYEKREGTEPLVLIISTIKYLNIFKKDYKNKLKDIADYIEPDQDKEDKNLHICEAYRILLKDEEANIGWRLLLYYDKLPQPELWGEILEESKKNVPLVELIPDEYKKKHQDIIKLIGKLKNSTEYTKIKIEHTLEHLVDNSLKKQIIEFFTNKEDEDLIKARDKIYPIQFVTYQGSKGLAADYVFILGMNDGDLPKDPSSITDYEICEFIVGLTRTKKECYIIPISNVYSKRKRKSTFLSWIENERVIMCKSLSVEQVRQIFNDKSNQHN